MNLLPLLTRRDWLRVGAVTLSSIIARPAIARSRDSFPNVILLWMAGGVTHHESFDPKPDAPEEIRGTLRSLATTIPGVRFAEVMPELAQQAHRLSLIRTYSSGNDDHFLSQAAALSGRKVTPTQITTEPNVGAVVSKLRGAQSGFPGYIAIPGTTRPGPPPKNLFTGGWLGEVYGPFPTGGKPRNEDFTARVKELDESEFNKQGLQLVSGMDSKRLADRRTLRDRLDDAARAMDPLLSQQYHGAFDMLLAPAVRSAFDLDRESPFVRDRYGRTKIGARCLLARRLTEAGARFVMVDYGYDPEYGNLWDQHNAAGQNFPHICEMVKRPYHLAGVDRAVAALIQDLVERGRFHDTLVIFLTEFGRTPRINKDGGRDHWGRAGSIFFAGGGTAQGLVVGATDRNGAIPTTASYTPGDVAATIYDLLGIDLDTTLYDRQNRPIPMLPDGRPIPGVRA